MKRPKFRDSQIVDAFKRVEAGIGVPDTWRELGSSPDKANDLKVCGLKLPKV